MKFKILFTTIILIFFIQSVSALSCGNGIREDVELNKTLYCENNGLTIKKGSINCNNNVIKGRGEGIGIKIKGGDRVEIKNCKIENFSKGIQLEHEVRAEGYGWGTIGYRVYFSVYSKILNNSLTNNEIGIFAKKKSSKTLIKNSIFINNSISGVHVSGGRGNVLNNTFINSNISYKKTSGVDFCKNNKLENKYINSTGPKCSCKTLSKTSLIDQDTTLCSQKYPIKNKIKLEDNTKLNCNNATIKGINNQNTAFLIDNKKNTQINNCNFNNFSTAIKYTIGYDYLHGNSNNYILNSTFRNVDIAVLIENNSKLGNRGLKKIANSKIIANNYTIKNKYNYRISAKNNYYGTNNYDKIKSQIYNFKKLNITKTKKLEKIIFNSKNSSRKKTFDFLLEDYNNIDKSNFNFYTIKNNKIQKINPRFDIENDFDNLNINFNQSNFNQDLFISYNNKTQNQFLEKYKDSILYVKRYFNISINNNSYKYGVKHYQVQNISKKNKTIILAGGLWSNFNTWEKLAKKLKQEGYEVFKIALTGEFLECRECYNYSYENLVNKVLPKKIDNIKSFSKNDDFIYIGHSNGARVFYEYINQDNLFSKIFLVGMPGDFNYRSPTTKLINNFQDEINNEVKNKKHISISQILTSALGFNSINLLIDIFSHSNGKISTSLFNYYLDAMTSNKNEIKSLDTNSKIVFINGDLFNGDGVVAKKDFQNIIKNTNANIKNFSPKLTHTQLTTHPRVHSIIFNHLTN